MHNLLGALVFLLFSRFNYTLFGLSKLKFTNKRSARDEDYRYAAFEVHKFSFSQLDRWQKCLFISRKYNPSIRTSAAAENSVGTSLNKRWIEKGTCNLPFTTNWSILSCNQMTLYWKLKRNIKRWTYAVKLCKKITFFDVKQKKIKTTRDPRLLWRKPHNFRIYGYTEFKVVQKTIKPNCIKHLIRKIHAKFAFLIAFEWRNFLYELC